jgi:phage FluMu protein gp41
MAVSRPTERVSSPFAQPSAAAPVPAPASQPVALSGLRPLSGYEEELLERRRDQPNTAALCNEVLARCLVPPGQDPGSRGEEVQGLLVAERDRALVALRRMSFGDRIDTEVDCPSCGKTSDISFALDALPMDVPARSISISGETSVQLADGRTARLRMPTAGDQAELLDQPLETLAERRTWLLARLVTALGERSGPFETHEVHALRSDDRRRMEDALERVVPQIDLSMDVTCSECSHAFVAPFDIASFFLLS